MIWQQAAVSFLVWIAYGVYFRRHSDAVRARMARKPPRARGTYGTLMLIVSGVVLLFGLAGVGALGGMTREGLQPWAWLAVTVVGVMFVHLQTLGSLALVSMALESVTPNRPTSSSTVESVEESPNP